MKIIKVDNFDILVDGEDFDFLINAYDISINQHGYPYCKLKEKYKNRKMGLYTHMTMHKILMFPDKTGRGINIDHIDGNRLNNQKENLRICEHAENMRNRKPNKSQLGKNPASKFKGIWWNKKLNLWRVQIRYNYERIHVGCFTNEIAAANAYNYYAQELHKEFAKLNDVEFMEKEEWIKYKSAENKTSKHRGVSFYNNKWLAQICYKGKRERIGAFDTELEAVEAYNKRAKELRGDKDQIKS